MSTEKTSYNIVDTLKEKPVVSALCAAWFPAAVGIGQAADVIQSDIGLRILEGMFYAAPVAAATATGIGLANIVRNKSAISKPFSAAAIGTGVLTAMTWRQAAVADPDGVVMAFNMLFSGAMASAGGAANLVSHYTRNIGPKIGVVKPREPSA